MEQINIHSVLENRLTKLTFLQSKKKTLAQTCLIIFLCLTDNYDDYYIFSFDRNAKLMY